MEIVPDPLLVAMFLPGYLLAVLGSWFILWKPLFDWMQERESTVTEARAEAASLDEQIAERLEQVEFRLQGARSEIAELRNTERAAVAQAEADIIAVAREQAEERIAKASHEIAQQSEIARKGLANASRALADDMASQVLGRSVQA